MPGYTRCEEKIMDKAIKEIEKEFDGQIDEQEQVEPKKSFRKELKALINCHNKESGSDTLDFILAYYLIDCLDAFDRATRRRTKWYGREEKQPATASSKKLADENKGNRADEKQ